MTTLSVTCQICHGKGHGARVCPSRKKKPEGPICQICEKKGHEATECEDFEDDVAADGEVGSEDEDCVSECFLCYAPENEECTDAGCERAADRAERIEALPDVKPPPSKKTKTAGGKSTTVTPATAATFEVGSTVSIKPDDIIKMSKAELSNVKVGQITMLPTVWFAWLRSLPKGSRLEAHRRLMAGVRFSADRLCSVHQKSSPSVWHP